MNPEYIYTVFPEIFLASVAMILLIVGAIRGDRSGHVVSFLSLVALLVAGVLVVQLSSFEIPGFAPLHIKNILYGHDAFNNMFVNDGFSQFVKIILLVGGVLSLMLSWSWLEIRELDKPEYPVLLLLAVVGMMVMVSANDWLSLYVGLELQSLALYVMAAFNREHTKSSEAGLKYFVLGALASGFILYGISLLYGYAGTTSFTVLTKISGLQDHLKCIRGVPCLMGQSSVPLGAILGLVFICAAMAFKISAVPFHMWTPDVYEGAPTPVTAFFAAAPKVAALALLTRILFVPLAGLQEQWSQIIIFMALASMLLGSFAGLVQTNIKRLLAYSSIANVGYALVGLAAGGTDGVQAVLIFLAIYFLNTLGVFGVILCMRRNDMPAENISDFAGLAKNHKLLALAMLIFMFSLAGIPWFAGFFGKYFIFLAAVRAGLVPLAVIGVLTSVVSCAYYLRLVKLMYFDEPTAAIDPVSEYGLRLVLGLAAFGMLFLVLWPSPLIDSALVAAQSS